MPKQRVLDAMKLAMFSDKDIADLGLRRFLQRALPGGTVKAMKVHLGAFLPPEPPPTSCHDRCQKRLVDELVAASSKAATEPVNDLLSTKMDQLVAAATKPSTRGLPASNGNAFPIAGKETQANYKSSLLLSNRYGRRGGVGLLHH